MAICIEILPGISYNMVGMPRPLKVKITQGRRVCEEDHPDGIVLETQCIFRYKEAERTGFSSDLSNLPEIFEAEYKFPDNSSYMIRIRKACPKTGAEFWLVPDCTTKVMEVFYGLKARRQRASAQGRRMQSIARKAVINRVRKNFIFSPGEILPANIHVPRPANRHVCDPSSPACSPVGSPKDSTEKRINPSLVVPVDATREPCNNKRKAEEKLFDPRPTKVARS